MLSMEQVKPLLLHEDRPVRDLAVDYFRSSWSQDAALVPMILRACRQYGVDENVHGLIACGQFVLSESPSTTCCRCLPMRGIARQPGDFTAS